MLDRCIHAGGSLPGACLHHHEQLVGALVPVCVLQQSCRRHSRCSSDQAALPGRHAHIQKALQHDLACNARRRLLGITSVDIAVHEMHPTEGVHSMTADCSEWIKEQLRILTCSSVVSSTPVSWEVKLGSRGVSPPEIVPVKVDSWPAHSSARPKAAGAVDEDSICSIMLWASCTQRRFKDATFFLNHRVPVQPS